MQVFDLQSKISLDSSDFFSGLRKSERGMKDFEDKMAMGFDKLKSAAKWLVTGVAVKQGVDAIKTLANETANAGDRIDKQSQALGISRKAFQEWDYILGQSGASIDSLGFSMKTLSSAPKTLIKATFKAHKENLLNPCTWYAGKTPPTRLCLCRGPLIRHFSCY